MKVFEVTVHREYTYRLIAEDEEDATMQAKERVYSQPDGGHDPIVNKIKELPIGEEDE